MTKPEPLSGGETELAAAPEAIILRVALREEDLPAWASRETLAAFFHETMMPYEDTRRDIERALDYAFSASEGKGGFLVLAERQGRLAGAVLMLKTGMDGYVPPYLLVFVSVAPDLRGRGIGRRIIERALATCAGPVKLHVEYENPARRLYERIGFISDYAEMRYRP
jgi:ribosomal-protein-alanine N-acetyltransferase